MKSVLSRRARVLVATIGVTVVAGIGVSSASPAHSPAPSSPKPTVVLVHGAWADSGAWDGVVSRLQRHGYPVDVFPTPLQSLSGDSGALSEYLAAISGPIVLVGHSYGGAVITNAATGDTHVKALVYLDAFAPDQGQIVQNLPGPNSVLANPDPAAVFRFVPNAAPTPATDLYVLPSLFPSAFANDLPPGRAAVLAASQRPITLLALNEPTGTPAWQSIPSWYEIGTIDKVIPASEQLKMAQRAGAHISYARTGHLPMISQPATVDRLIETAASATS